MTSRRRSKARRTSDPLVVGGWSLFAHPLLLDQVERLIAAVERERRKNPKTYRTSASAKVLAAIGRLMFEVVPQDPARPEYRQGGTLGDDRKHWFRAKFGAQRYRLFFRFSTRAKVIVYAWVNDAGSLRTYGARTDAYAVFSSMLDKGSPPDDWERLLTEAAAQGAGERLSAAAEITRRG